MLEHETHQSTFLHENGNGQKNGQSGHNGNGSNGAGRQADERRRVAGGGKSKREVLLETIRTAQAELERLNQWRPGDRVLVPGICEGIADDLGGRVMVRLDGVARAVELPEELLQRVGVRAGAAVSEDSEADGAEAVVEDMHPEVAQAGEMELPRVAAAPLPVGVSGVGAAHELDEARRRLEILSRKRHADHRDLPCGACEAEAILELLDGVVALPEVEKWRGVKATGDWVDVSEVGRRRLVAIDKDSALQLAAALIAAAGAVGKVGTMETVGTVEG